MSNYNLVNDRTNALTKIPRLSFMTPEDQNPGSQINTNDIILFCQSGCQLEFNFSDISGCVLNNDGTYFSITPTGDAKTNYVLWNGSNIQGLEMVSFYLKEVYFGLPAKDRVNTSQLNQTIQLYFSFVSDQKSDLMICVSCIGQANNVGNAMKTNGFTLMDTLSNSIPLSPGQQVNLDGLSQFNLGALLPQTSSFFSTIILDSKTQYVMMTKIIDIPMNFFNNLVARVLGSRDKYDKQFDDFSSNPPVNPPKTILFFNENVKPVGIDDGFVCDSGCNMVPSQGQQLSPTIGGARSQNSTRPVRRVISEEDGKKIYTQTGEECIGEEMEPGSVPITQQEKITQKQDLEVQSVNVGFFIAVVLLGLVAIVFFTLMITMILNKKYPDFIASGFTRAFWKPTNTKDTRWLILILFTFITLTACIIASIVCYTQYNANAVYNSPDEQSNLDSYWISLVVGCAVWGLVIIIIFILLAIYKKNFLGNTYESVDGNDTRNIIPKLNSNQMRVADAYSQIASNPAILQSPEGLEMYNRAINSFNKLPPTMRNRFADVFGPSARDAVRRGEGLSDIAGKGFMAGPGLINAIKQLNQEYPENPFIKKVVPIVTRNPPIVSPAEIQALAQIQDSRLK